MEIGTSVYVNYRGSQCYAEVIGREFPYYVVRLTSSLEIRVYRDELEKI